MGKNRLMPIAGLLVRYVTGLLCVLLATVGLAAQSFTIFYPELNQNAILNQAKHGCSFPAFYLNEPRLYVKLLNCAQAITRNPAFIRSNTVVYSVSFMSVKQIVNHSGVDFHVYQHDVNYGPISYYTGGSQHTRQQFQVIDEGLNLTYQACYFSAFTVNSSAYKLAMPFSLSIMAITQCEWQDARHVLVELKQLLRKLKHSRWQQVWLHPDYSRCVLDNAACSIEQRRDWYQMPSLVLGKWRSGSYQLRLKLRMQHEAEQYATTQRYLLVLSIMPEGLVFQ